MHAVPLVLISCYKVLKHSAGPARQQLSSAPPVVQDISASQSGTARPKNRIIRDLDRPVIEVVWIP